MTDDPRAQARLRGASYRELTHVQQLERIKQRLAPSDDDLPIAQAVRDKELRRKNVEGSGAVRGEEGIETESGLPTATGGSPDGRQHSSPRMTPELSTPTETDR